MIEENGGDGDQVFQSNGVTLFVDPISIRYLKGAEVDFVETVTGGGFTIKNPNATSTCGCGSSFSTEEGGGAPRPQPLRGSRSVPGSRLATNPERGTWNRPVPRMASIDVERVRPAGGKRSSKRDFIVNAFLRQEGHLSADDLVDLIRKEDRGISRATVYRTLQWMMDAGIARKVDFGEGRFRFEHSYRHPRHFHLICKTCNQSFEFLSSDIEALIEEVAAARKFAGKQSVVQIYGTCEDCQTGRPTALAGGTSEMIFARDALRIAIATERSGLEFYTRAARITQDRAGPHGFSEARRGGEGAPRARSRRRYAQLLKVDPQLESRPAFLFFKGAANGLFAEGADRLSKGVNDQQALLIGIQCERGSHRFFKKYGERFEDSEGKQIFMEFAEEEKQHLELLIREYKSLINRKGRRRPAQVGRRRAAAPTPSVIDLHLHTTASDGLCDPAVLVDLAWRAGIRTMSVTDHDTVAALPEVESAAAASGIAFVPGIEITAVHEGRDVHMLGYFIDRDDAELAGFLERQRADRVRRVGEMAEKLAEHG